MRTRTFLGLILLVAALIVASTPALLTPAATGVERLAVEAGVLEDQKLLAKERERAQDKREQDSGITVDERLELKGFTVEKDEDLRDTKAVGEREVNERGRLEAGSRRVLMPGQKPGTDAYSPPFAAEDGVLLDIDGCPVFREEADVAAMMANPETKTLYDGKVTTADDAAACRTVFNERIAIATADDDAEPLLPGDRREMAASVRGSSERLLIEAYRVALYENFFSDTDAAELAADTRAALRGGSSPAAATDTAKSAAADEG